MRQLPRFALNIRLRKALTAAAVSAALLLPGTGVHATGMPADGMLAFDIVREGERIGSHTYRFEESGDRVLVDIQTDIDFRLFFLPVYTFKHVSHEEWVDGRLLRMVSQTNDNGKPVRIEVRPSTAGLIVEQPKSAQVVDESVVPDSLWNSVILERDRAISTVGGTVRDIGAEFVGRDSVDIDGKSIEARHFKLTGENERDLWYDDNNVLLRVSFTARDGSNVQYVRK